MSSVPNIASARINNDPGLDLEVGRLIMLFLRSSSADDAHRERGKYRKCGGENQPHVEYWAGPGPPEGLMSMICYQ
jgi:hypothetical protein